ncbi:MAG TPA: hypothetical protein VMV27_17280 [Candidatus Binataceae bacterium]|nr:hypothetical protein [Candidatus Binataceae bacterium]
MEALARLEWKASSESSQSYAPRKPAHWITTSIANLKEQRRVYIYVSLGRRKYVVRQSQQEVKAEAIDPAIESEFQSHVERWRKETLYLSSIARKLAHPDYLAITSMGKKVIPLLLRELEERPSYWFGALKALAKDENPPKEENTFDGTVKAWLVWGKARDDLQKRSTTGSRTSISEIAAKPVRDHE